MARVYSTYEAKAKLSEILRKVRTGQSVGITYRGDLVAEVRPVNPLRESLEERIRVSRPRACSRRRDVRTGESPACYGGREP